MKVRYLPTAEPGLHALRAYCQQNPQLDPAEILDALCRAEAALSASPYSGHRYEDFDAVREHKIGGAAFSLIYSVSRDTIWIIDVRDPRGHRSAEALRSVAEGSAEALRRLVKGNGRAVL
jgi:hypothetical protein